MGWFTKKSHGWEIKRLAWTIVSILAVIPLPIHLFPVAFIAQGYRAKVRAWVITGIVFLVAEIAIWVIYVLSLKHFEASIETFLFTNVSTFVSYIVLYVMGNILLLRNVRPYLKRLELGEVVELQWVNSVRTIQQIWKPNTVNSPQVFIAQLLSDRGEINNYQVRKDIDQIIRHFKTIINKDFQRAELLAVRHQTILSLLSQYKTLQKNGTDNNVAATSKTEIEKVLGQATTAVEKEVNLQYETQLLSVTAERDAYLQQLRNRKLIQ
ncbi:MAG: hypothetical protein QM610_12000 [Chitinophagaceae bacterium]